MRFGVQVPRVRPPSTVELDRLLTEARAAAPTYPEVGATRDAHLPPGYRHDSYERRLGPACARVWPEGACVEEGSTVVLLLPVGGLWALGARRVVDNSA
jgi:hypothetical protein